MSGAGSVLFDGTLFADYFQVYLQDAGRHGAGETLPDDFSDAATGRA